MTHPVKTILDKYPGYEATIGTEVHVQLKTRTKIFCACQNQFGDEPNTNICEVCAGYPGALPVLNKQVLDSAIMAGLATNCTIATTCQFDRKHYMYPDLPKNYQITQDEKPICTNGFVMIDSDGNQKKIRLMRIHMEEDAGKNLHTNQGVSFVDLNRAGTPLLEMVSQPDMGSSEEARQFLTKIHSIVQYLGISDANMEEGSFRADVNISVKKKGAEKLGTKVEIKNVNSFKFIVQAIDYEIERQIEMLESGHKIIQETRLWDSKLDKTFSMRSKEEAKDYRYFTDPDLPLIEIDEAWLMRMQKLIPELPDAKIKRLQADYGLTLYEADVLATESKLADFFEQTVVHCEKPKQASNWILRDLLGFMKEHKQDFVDLIITPRHVADLISALEAGVINNRGAQIVFAEAAKTGASVEAIINEHNLKQIGSTDELIAVIKPIIDNNPKQVEQYRAGNDRLFGFFVGQAMQATKGKGDPKVINDLLKKLLENK